MSTELSLKSSVDVDIGIIRKQLQAHDFVPVLVAKPWLRTAPNALNVAPLSLAYFEFSLSLYI
ncbi:unnamed protein product [Prunus armeniaca]|uniref:Uncharacterized protein n=1 Tax=Prunus armeniaca TaxID=36596 RepID=A0A6J5XNG5_PRUAR|nr:unnamed protein product [Prunus armeniaca]